MLPVEQPFKTYTGLDGKPLDNGYVYFGQPDLNPVTSPAAAYWDPSGTIPASQPLRTLGGYIVRGGSPANVYLSGAYSILVQDSKGRQVFYARSSDDFSIVSTLRNFEEGLQDKTGAAGVGTVQAGAGAVARTVSAKLNEVKSLADFGAVGDGINDDTNSIQAALNAAPKNTSVLMVGIIGSRFRVGDLTIPDYVSLIGSGANFGMTDVYNGSAFNSCGATLLLNPNSKIKMGNGSAFKNAHVFPYGMSFPQPNSSSWAGTAIVVNRGAETNTVDVVLANLLICGFARAVDGYWCPRLICENVNFDCNNGIRVVTAGDPIRFFNCHGWPFATIAAPVVTDAGARDRRTGSAFEFFTNADAGKVTNCFAFGYTVGFDVNMANGITFLSCGADDYNLLPPLTSIGWRISGSCGLTVLTSCQSVAHQFGASMDAADDTNILQVNGGLFGANAEENFHLLKGTLVLRGVALGAAKTAVGVFGAGNRLAIGGCVAQGLTTQLVLNSGGSPHVYIGSDNITQDISVPIYSGPAIENAVDSADNVSLPTSGDNITVNGSTNIFGFSGGWPGRVVHIRFNGSPTLSDSASMQLAGNYTASVNSVLSLRFTSATQCYEVSRSNN